MQYLLFVINAIVFPLSTVMHYLYFAYWCISIFLNMYAISNHSKTMVISIYFFFIFYFFLLNITTSFYSENTFYNDNDNLFYRLICA